VRFIAVTLTSLEPVILIAIQQLHKCLQTCKVHVTLGVHIHVIIRRAALSLLSLRVFRITLLSATLRDKSNE
jgi:hypothetical protein